MEDLSPDMIAVLRAMTGAERLAVANGMFRSARRMLTSHLESEHPEWPMETVQREVARRLASGSG